MMRDTPVAELDALTATADERDFETVAQHVREVIESFGADHCAHWSDRGSGSMQAPESPKSPAAKKKDSRHF